MSEYTKQVKALLSASTVSTAWGKMMQDAAVAIEALQAQLPKRGEWLNVTDSYHWYGKCSICGEEFVVDAYYAGGMNFCPNCGADMRLKQGRR